MPDLTRRSVGLGRRLVAMGLALILGPAWCVAATRYSVLAGGEAWLHPESGGHGLVMAAADRGGLPRDGRLGLEYHTDTFRLSAEGFRCRDGRLELGVRAESEALYAGLMPDYYRGGRVREERGFWASYAAAQVGVKLNLPHQHYPEVSFGVRQWWLARRDRTAPGLVLPPGAPVLEMRLRHTWWRLADDAAWHQRHRTFPRTRGVAAGMEVGLDRRGRAEAWGARDPEVFSPADGRNEPETVIRTVRQWLRAGRQVGPGWRLQLLEQAAWGWGEDDLTRLRLGGMNPYVVPLAGAPWAAWLSGRMGGTSMSLHRRLGGDTEAGVAADAALVDDAARTGTSAAQVLAGCSAFLDGRVGAAQVDARLGWMPDVPGGDGGQISAYLAVGYAWE